MRGLGRIILKLFGISGIFFLFGILGIIFAVRDSSKNIGANLSFDFKMDILFIAVGFIGGSTAAFVKMKRNKKTEEEAAEREKEAMRRAKSDPKYYDKPKPAPQTVSPENIPLKAITDKVLHELPAMPMIPLIPKRAQTSVFDSKLGGTPYMPKGFAYPVGTSGSYAGKPLKFLAQLNFGALPHIQDFPEEGILQFFCSCDCNESVYGLDFNDPCSQNGFKVIYHENVITDRSALMSAEEMPVFDKCDFPIDGEYRLCPHAPQNCTPTACDFRFDKAFSKAYSEMTGTKISSVYDAYEGKFNDGKTMEDVFDFIANGISCIGGYPDFTQRDPRNSANGTENYTVLLFQLQSSFEDGIDIMWGDSGVGNFFITPDALKNRDFSKVMFCWDCF